MHQRGFFARENATPRAAVSSFSSGAALVSAQLVLNATRASMHGFERGFLLDLLVWKRFEARAKTALRSRVGALRNAHLLCTQAHFATAPRDLLCTP